MQKPCDEALDKVAHVVADAFKGEISDRDAVAEIAGVLDDEAAAEGAAPPTEDRAKRRRA